MDKGWTSYIEPLANETVTNSAASRLEDRLEEWITEAEDSLDRGLPLLDENGEQMTMASTRELLAMWREELARTKNA